ncbi:MAG TPA: PAS domain-containing protein [Casimicrobiaceae bacterium]|nr:PAS domain-containing protein [Casimicrobiaceae bacterium]
MTYTTSPAGPGSSGRLRPRTPAADLEAALDRHPCALVLLDRNGLVRYASARALELLGAPASGAHTLIGRALAEAFPDLRGSAVEAACRSRDEAGPIDFAVVRHGEQRWIELRVAPVADGVTVSVLDATQHKRAERLLGCEKAVLEKIVAGAPLEEVLDTLARCVESLSTTSMLCSVLRLDGDRLLHGAAPSLPAAYNGAIDGVRIGPAVGSCGTAAYERRPVDATDIATDPRWADYRDLAAAHGLAACCSTPVFDSQGNVLGTVAMYYRAPTTPGGDDRHLIAIATRLASVAIERHRAAEALRRSEEFSRSIVDSSHDCIKTLALDGTLLWMNAQGCRVLGVADARDIEGRSYSGLWDGEDAGRARDAVEAAARGGVGRFLGRLEANGSARFWNVVISPIPGADGHPERLVAVSRDVTDRVEREQALQQREAELRALADSIPQLAWMARADGHIFWYNRPWYEYTGTSPEQMEGWGWQSVHDPAVLPEVLRRWRESVATGTPFEMEFPLRSATGEFRMFLTRVNPVRDAEGRVVRWFGTNTDVEQVRRVREALEEETRTLELLNRTGATLASSLDLESLLQAVTDAGTGLSGAKFGAFFYNATNADGDVYMLYTLTGAPREAFEGFGHPRATDLFGPTFRGEGIIRCDDVRKDPRYGKWAPHHGMPKGHLPVCSYLAVPVIARSGEVLGGLFFAHPSPGVFTQRAERLVAAVAAQAAIAIDNARLYQAAQRASEERSRLLASERHARSEAEHTSRMKDEFLATLSHELRTPLSAILGWAQVLRSGRASPADVQVGLDAIERNARAQTQLIEDLLDMSRIVSGKLRLDVRAAHPASFVEAAIETVRPAANAKDIRLELACEPGLQAITGDAARLQQVVWNLLANAIKFTPRGGRIQVALRSAGPHVEIRVADDGVGIAPAFLPHVFDRFRQADASVTRHFGGLGLGLSIVRHLVELHGGTVRAESAGEGRGATFTVALPVAAALDGEAATTDSPGTRVRPRVDFHPVDLSEVRILVVDDQSDARELIARVLVECNATVETAGSADEALPMIERFRPAILVSDIGMPGTDGYEFLRKVRALGTERGGQIPAIALTAFARAEDRMQALRAGFLVHLPKPVEPGELVATVASVVDRVAERRPGPPPPR